MKKFKRLFAGLLTAILLLSVTGCSGDTTWVFKTENDTVPAGVYLAYMMDAYNQAKTKLIPIQIFGVRKLMIFQ